ncbi:MAG: SDR family oxidoreductase [Firmicutes bacterium]|nr:SDR family oxidoreductase [Bacillota bacterium]
MRVDSYFDMTRRRILVTGATRGIGSHLARRLCERGASVALCGRSIEDLEQQASLLRGVSAGDVITVAMDVRDVASVRAGVATAIAGLGGLDGLVNNAGVNIRKKALQFSEEDWDTVVDTDLKGAFFVAQAAGEWMCGQGHGAMVNIASVGGQVALRTGTAYAAAKAGVMHMTRSLACEWASKGVRVNALGPWYFKTPLTEPLLADPAYLADILARTPMGRVGELDELVGPVVFLLSDAASYVTGQTLLVDGGMGVYGF